MTEGFNMNVSNFYFNYDFNVAVVVLNDSSQYHFEAGDNSDELDSIIDMFIYDFDNTVNKYSVADSEEHVQDFEGWDNLTHEFVTTKFVGTGYTPKFFKKVV